MHHAVEKFEPDVVVIDPMTNLLSVGTQTDVRAMLTRVIDFLKMRAHGAVHQPDLGDADARAHRDDDLVADGHLDPGRRREEAERQRQRWLYVLKSRGMAHSDEVREFRITERRRRHPGAAAPANAGRRARSEMR